MAQPPVPEGLDLLGQTGIITGGNTGIGFEAAHALLDLDLSRLIITTRSEAKGAEAVAKLEQLHPSAKIEAWTLDMLSYESIQAFARRCSVLDRIDFVILNAGTKSGDFITSENTGHEIVFQVNYLSTVLLALLLLPVLRTKHSPAKAARLTLIGSGLALTAKFPEQNADTIISAFDQPVAWGTQVAQERYSTTKLLLLMFLVKVKDYVNPEDVVVNVADPGFVKSAGLDRSLPAHVRAIFALMRSALGRDIKAAASTYVDAAVIKPDSTHGSWLSNWTVFPFPAIMHTPEGEKIIEKLWDETIEELDFVDAKGIFATRTLTAKTLSS
ncbi:short chain dehydrogenase [Lophiostoma macrostomum CBS 122681]|uniref:Short chain dehydrogenase n=1 Tax=Lophiostoma macrostomum CBS 122681 TaxID=1314788 RepID=A0A6A6T3L0_9PLEO|nr:short chain dehydrogenase [Lophiostoma macrostomum CBS 122681]